VSGLDRVADGIYRLGTEWVGWYLCDVDRGVTVVDYGLPRVGWRSAARARVGSAVEAGGWLVEEEHGGLTEDGAGERQPL
jgi:hypothetical protein